MASRQLKFQYAILKSVKLTSALHLYSKPYFQSTKPLYRPKPNQTLWRTLNSEIDETLPIGNCWTCGLLTNVYSCEICRANHTCKSCSMSYTAICPFAPEKTRYQVDAVDLETADTVTDDLLCEKLLPIYKQYFRLLMSANINKLKACHNKQVRKGNRAAGYTSELEDQKNTFLPLNAIAFRTFKYPVMTTYILFGHYEPTRNRHRLIDYTNLNLRHYRKLNDQIVAMNIELALARGRANDPMLCFDITPNAIRIPVLDSQKYVNPASSGCDGLVTPVLTKDDKVAIIKPPLHCYEPVHFMEEVVTASIIRALKIKLNKLQTKHYAVMTEIALDVGVPDQHYMRVEMPELPDFAVWLQRVNFSLTDAEILAESVVHMNEHRSEVTGCASCSQFKSLVNSINMNCNDWLSKNCCYVDYHGSDDLSGLFTVKHRYRHAIRPPTDYILDFYKMVLYYEILDKISIYSLNRASWWNSPSPLDLHYLTLMDIDQALNEIQKLWPLSSRQLFALLDYYGAHTHLNKCKVISTEHEEMTIVVESGEELEVIELPDEFKWMRKIMVEDIESTSSDDDYESE